MSDLREAAQQALEAMEAFMEDSPRPYDAMRGQAAMEAIRAALAEPVQPVAWRITDGEGDWEYRTDLPEDWSIQWSARYGRKYEPLYTAPPQRKPLSEEEISAIDWKAGETLHDFARAIERAHGIGDSDD